MTRCLIAGFLILLVQQAGAGLRSDAVSRSVLKPVDRARLLRGATLDGSVLRSLQSRSNFGPSVLAEISRRSEHDPRSASRLRAEYTQSEMLTIARRSEGGLNESRAIDAASDPAQFPGRPASSGGGAWAGRVNRQSTPSPDIVQATDALRALLMLVQKQSVEGKRPAPASDGKSRRRVILSQSVD